MPYFDGTGPRGQGPMSGGGRGPCGKGMGFGHGGAGRGFGRGRGFLSWFSWPSKNQVKDDLSQYQKELEIELEKVKAEQEKISQENGN